MAKKKSKTTKPSTGAKAQKAPARKASKKSPPKRHDNGHDHCGDHLEEIELDDTERKTIDLVVECDEIRQDLELEVSSVVAQAVRKICKSHGTTLTAAQAQNVAMVLFGD
jgi:hypothetical protein